MALSLTAPFLAFVYVRGIAVYGIAALIACIVLACGKINTVAVERHSVPVSAVNLGRGFVALALLNYTASSGDGVGAVEGHQHVNNK